MIITHWHWLVIAMLFFIADVMIGGGFLLWIGVAALTLSMVTWVIPMLAWNYQLLLFSVTVVGSCFGWWHYLKHRPQNSQASSLNQRTRQYVGQSYNLIEPIINGRGKIRLGDSSWLVSGPNLPVDSLVKIIDVNGTILIVEQDNSIEN